MTASEALKAQYRERCIAEVERRASDYEDAVDAVLELIAADMDHVSGTPRIKPSRWILEVPE